MAARTGLAGVSLMVEGLLSGSSQRGWSTVLTSPLHQTCGGWRVGGGGVLTGLVPGHWGSLLTHRKAIAGPFLGSRDFKGDFKGSRGDFKPFLGFRGDVS